MPAAPAYAAACSSARCTRWRYNARIDIRRSDYLNQRTARNPRQREARPRRTAGEIGVIDSGQIGIALLISRSGGAARRLRRAVIRPQAEEHLHVQEAVHRAAPGLHPALHVLHRELGVVLDVPGICSGLSLDPRPGDPIDARRRWPRNTRPHRHRAAVLLQLPAPPCCGGLRRSGPEEGCR